MGSFYKEVDQKTYKNTFYAMCIELDNYLAAAYLNNDKSRIVYSSTDYALIKRSGQNEWNNANLPFINYKLSNKETGGVRNWFNFSLVSQGVYFPELKRKIKVIPVSFSFDCTYFTGRDDDWQFATDKILLDNSLETKFTYYLEYNGHLVANMALLNFQTDMSPQFTERDWLEKNNIWSFSLNPIIQTNMFISNDSGFCIPKTVLINFLVKKDLIPASDGEIIEYEEAFRMTVDHFNEIVVPV